MRLSILILFLLTSFIGFGQNSNVGINTLTPEESAILDITSGDKGVLLPRLTSAQRMAIVSPANSLIVFDTDLNEIFMYDESITDWRAISQEESEGFWTEMNGNIINNNTASVGINTASTPDPSAILEIFSNTGGILIPRMTTVQRMAIANPANALLVFDTDAKTIFFYDSSTASWQYLSSGVASYWELNGDKLYNTNMGNVGIGTTNANKNLEIKGNANGNVGLALTEADSSYSIIIEIDETNDGIEFIGSDGTTDKTLLYIDANGNTGIGTTSVDKRLNVKSNGMDDVAMELLNANGDYSVIIEIDETNDGFQVIGDDLLTQKSLLYIDKDGKTGLGTTTPEKSLHIQGTSNNTASIALSEADSTNSIIIEIDETNDGIEFISTDGTNDKSLMYLSESRIGFGTNTPESSFHIKSDANNPLIKMSKTGSTFEYNMGFDSISNSFVLERDTLLGGVANILEFDSTGDITINSNNAINLESNVVHASSINTNSVTIQNVVTGANTILSADTLGNLVIPGAFSNTESYLDFNVQAATVSFTDVPLQYYGAATSFNGSQIQPTTNSDSITISEGGIYQVSYSLQLFKPNEDGDLDIRVNGYVNNIALGKISYTQTYRHTGYIVLEINRMLELQDGDIIQFSIGATNYDDVNDTFHIVGENSYINLLKFADN